MLELKNPDYATAVRIVDAINAYARGALPCARRLRGRQPHGRALPPAQISFARFMAEIGELQVQPDMAARVVLDARTGTVVVGQDVQISTVAVTYGTLTVRVNEQPQVSQPNPFAQRPNGRDAEYDDQGRADRRTDRHRRRIEPAHAGRRPEPHRRQAAGHHRHIAGDQDRRRASGRSR